nr:uncharacterized protein LOC129281437 [Lytechinus pictus]
MSEVQVDPEDSVSQTGRSTSSSSVARAKARKAVIQAEVELEALQERQKLELEELKLSQKKAELELRTKLRLREADELVYQEIDEEGSKVSKRLNVNIKSRSVGIDSTLAYGTSDVPKQLDVTQAPPARDEPLMSASKDNDLSCEILKHLKLGQENQHHLLESINLPTAELMKFNGDPLKYHEFLQSFECLVGETSLSASGKLMRLFHSCEGVARTVIQCYMMMPPDRGYTRARELLAERFGNYHKVEEAWLRRVTEGSAVTNSNKHLRDFADELRTCSETLGAMGATISSQRELVKIIGRLPFSLRSRWLKLVKMIRDTGRSPNIYDVVRFVSDAADEMNDPVYGALVQGTGGHVGKRDKDKSSTRSNFSVSIGQQKCLLCQSEHGLFGCQKFKDMVPEERFKFACEHKLCFNCLKPGHMTSRCKLDRTCSVKGCTLKHTKFLHTSKQAKPSTGDKSGISKKDEKVGNQRISPTQIDDREHVGQAASSHASSHRGSGRLRVALPIIPVKVRAANGRTAVDTFALLDNGSTNSFCLKELAERLDIKGRSQILSVSTLEKRSSEVKCEAVNLKVSGLGSDVELDVEAYTRPKLNISMENMAREADISQSLHLQDLNLPVTSYSQVTMLIGQDVPEALMPLEVKSGRPGELFAVKTVLGWTLNGPLGSNRSGDRAIYGTSCEVNFIDLESGLDEQVRRFWEVEGNSFQGDKPMSLNDKKTIEIWQKTIKKVDGHFQLAIPFKESPPQLENNRSVAEQRLNSLGRRLRSDPELQEKYKDGMEDLVQKGYAEEVMDDAEKQQGAWYIPHHPVFHPKKGKLRIVFDCASKFRGKSLNDVVMQGPDLTNNLLGVLLRFRQSPIAIMGDIASMFHQVRVPCEERELLRFLWWPDGNLQESPRTYRMCVHLFGGTWSPSACSFALRRAAEEVKKDDIRFEAATTVSKCFYVDDYLASLEDESTAVKQVADLTSLLRDAGFKLTKWISNSPSVLGSVPEEERAKEVKGLDLNVDALPVERALGLTWDVDEDCFLYKFAPKEKPITRRGILSVLSSVYDPLGYACPFTLKAKLVLQELTRCKLGWDEQIPVYQMKSWTEWLQDLPIMAEFGVNRCVKPQSMGQVVNYELHHFADASEVAYGAVSYLVMKDDRDQVHSSIVLAKSHLAPLKKLTLPRLELLAAALAVKMDIVLTRELEVPISRSIYWTDSTIVLQYVRNDVKRFQTFVANRIATIRGHSEPHQWHHVNSSANPADDASRGMGANELIKNTRWLNGPDFIRQGKEHWPKDPTLPEFLDENDPEVKKEKKVDNAHAFAANAEAPDAMDILIEHYSSWHRLLKAVAWILRVRQLLRSKVHDNFSGSRGPISTEELATAEEAVIRYVQQRTYVEEYVTLLQSTKKGPGEVAKEIKGSSPLYKLDAKLTEKGLICVGGRLNNAPLDERSRHPLILPPKHHVVKLLIRHLHETSGHSGKEYVLSLLRQRYWVVRGRRAVRQEVGVCFKCKRRDATPVVQKMADLPADRVEPGRPPFTHVGVDCFGPYMVKQGRSQVKRYGCIFTCLVVRAIHIEVLHSMETDSFLNALQRFISRRGKPETIRCDNGSNFVGAEKELKEGLNRWNQSKIHDYLLQRTINWRFNPPAAPHMGGVWERLIRTTKKVLGSLMTQQVLSDEGLATLLCIVESIVNGRPLTVISDDVRDPEPLTPSHLLLLRHSHDYPVDNFEKNDVYGRRRWRRVQYLANVFWRRWVREYLPTLQLRQKWTKEVRNLKDGDIVLIVDDLPRNQWLIGRVIETYPGRDGLVRSLKVKHSSGTLVRPVHKVCLLEEVAI